MIELRTRDEASRWIAGGLCLVRVGRPGSDELRTVAPWLVSAVSEGGALPPPGVIADVGRLLGGGSLDYQSPLPTTHARLRGAVRRYEDQLLGRLAADPHLEAAGDALCRLPAALQPHAIALTVQSLVERLAFAGGASVSPAVARRVLQRPAEELVREGMAALGGDGGEGGALALALAEGYEGLALAAQRSRHLLTDSDVFTVENLAVLGSLTQRLAIAQVLECAEQLDRALPRRLARRHRPAPGGSTSTQLADESAYPVGGFSAIATTGSLENLVTSELIYMDEEVPEGDVDLFDMRYVEGELLYYTRDEAILVRRRHRLTIVLSPGLVRARFKDPDVPWQRIVVVMGLVLCAVRRLAAAWGDEALRFDVRFLCDDKGKNPLAEERDLLQLVLREWVALGACTVEEAPSAAQIDASVLEASRTGRSDILSFVFDGTTTLTRPPRARLVTVSAARAQPWPSWTDDARSLLEELL